MNQKSKVAAALFAFFLGGIGAHRLYLGYPWWWALVFVFTGFGVFGAWGFIEFIMILLGKMKDVNGNIPA
jgi:TM2 domain-containing membrane protein YozV